MFADSVDELVDFAKKIGMKEEWLQIDKAAHFDLTEKRRKDAVKAGAIELTKDTWREIYGKAKEQAKHRKNSNA